MSEQEINEMALLKVIPLISLGGKDRNFNDRLFYTQGAKDCNQKWEEKLRWIPIEEKLPEYSTLENKNRVNVKFINIFGEEEICTAELCQITQHCGENSPLLDVWYPFSSSCPLKNVVSWRSFL